MPNTSKGYPYPSGSDDVDVPGDIQALADAVDLTPGIRSYTSTQIAALAAGDKWAGRVVWNSTTSKLQVSDGSTFSDVDSTVTLSSATPQTLGTAAAGSSSDASRADHRHAMPSASDVGAVANALVNARGDLITATANDTPAILTAGSNGQMLMADSSATAGLRYVDPPANRNLIINGAMQVAQRATSVTGITTVGVRTADRWNTMFSGTLGTWTQTIENDAPTGSGFQKSLKMLCTTAAAAPSATSHVLVEQRIEGQNLQQLKKGTASAEQVTVSFWVKANVTGTYVVVMYDNANAGRIESKQYTISQSATWERKTLTFTGDTTGALPNDNSGAIRLEFHLASGSTYSSGSPQTWGAFTNANYSPGQTNLAAATNNYWQITGVQLETGPVATPFEFEPYEATLRKCQRYYYLYASGSNKPISLGSYYSSGSIYGIVQLPVTMRIAPSFVTTTGTDFYKIDRNVGTDTFNSFLDAGLSTTTAVLWYNNSEISGTAGQVGDARTNNASSSIAFSAEL